MDGVANSICPILMTRPGVCARVASGHAAATVPRRPMNRRRLMGHLRRGEQRTSAPGQVKHVAGAKPNGGPARRAALGLRPQGIRSPPAHWCPPCPWRLRTASKPPRATFRSAGRKPVFGGTPDLVAARSALPSRTLESRPSAFGHKRPFRFAPNSAVQHHRPLSPKPPFVHDCSFARRTSVTVDTGSAS